MKKVLIMFFCLLLTSNVYSMGQEEKIDSSKEAFYDLVTNKLEYDLIGMAEYEKIIAEYTYDYYNVNFKEKWTKAKFEFAAEMAAENVDNDLFILASKKLVQAKKALSEFGESEEGKKLEKYIEKIKEAMTSVVRTVEDTSHSFEGWLRKKKEENKDYE